MPLSNYFWKNSAYGRRWISWPMRIVPPLPWNSFRYIDFSPLFFWGFFIQFFLAVLKKWMVGGVVGGREDQWEAWNWSCDLRANKRPKKTAPNGRQTDRQVTHGHGDSMTESSNWGQFSENLHLIQTTLVNFFVNQYFR